MARKPTGQVLERDGARGTTFALRFRAYGKRRYVTLGGDWEGWTRQRAEVELENVLADVRRGIWREPDPAPVIEEPRPEPTFHQFASEWFEGKRPELKPRTAEDYEWALTHHLLPFFAGHRLSAITRQEVDRYKAAKIRDRERIERARVEAQKRDERCLERGLSNGTINKTLTRLAQILEPAVDYGLIPANPAVGKRRRLKADKPRRPWVEPEQLPSLLRASEGLLGGRGRPLLATLAGGGLRIDEALSLERRNVNLARGTLTVMDAKTAAGVRVVDLTPALRDELAVWLAGSLTELVFPTSTGAKDNRQNVRQRLLHKATERANVKLAELGIDPIGNVSPHGLRRTYAALRCAAGDDVAYTAAQIGHEDPAFTLRVYTQAVKRRQRLSENELAEFNRALEWAQWARERAPKAEALGQTGGPWTPLPPLLRESFQALH
jgi:integrase